MFMEAFEQESQGRISLYVCIYITVRALKGKASYFATSTHYVGEEGGAVNGSDRMGGKTRKNLKGSKTKTQ